MIDPALFQLALSFYMTTSVLIKKNFVTVFYVSFPLLVPIIYLLPLPFSSFLYSPSPHQLKYNLYFHSSGSHFCSKLYAACIIISLVCNLA